MHGSGRAATTPSPPSWAGRTRPGVGRSAGGPPARTSSGASESGGCSATAPAIRSPSAGRALGVRFHSATRCSGGRIASWRIVGGGSRVVLGGATWTTLPLSVGVGAASHAVSRLAGAEGGSCRVGAAPVVASVRTPGTGSSRTPGVGVPVGVGTPRTGSSPTRCTTTIRAVGGAVVAVRTVGVGTPTTGVGVGTWTTTPWPTSWTP